jgi:hypothetical protein
MILKRFCISVTNVSFIFFLTLIMLSCNSSPVGFDELERELTEPVSHEFYPQASDCYEKYIANGLSSSLILGQNREYESRVLLLFPLVDSSLDLVAEVRLVLYTKRQRDITFNVHIVSEAWQENGATWVKTDSAGYWLMPGANFSETSIGQGQIAEESTIVILSNIDSLVRRGEGIILIPQDSGFGFFYSDETGNKPKIVFKYPDQERSFQALADASIIDTVDLHLDRNDLWVGAGYAYHTYLKFNTDIIPEEATINNAELIIRLSSTFLLTDTIEIGIHRLLEPYQEFLRPKFSSSISAKGRFVTSDTLIQMDLRNLVQFWTLNRDSNFGIIINGYPEYFEIFRIELKKELTDRPLLKTGYILPPEGRF